MEKDDWKLHLFILFWVAWALASKTVSALEDGARDCYRHMNSLLGIAIVHGSIAGLATAAAAHHIYANPYGNQGYFWAMVAVLAYMTSLFRIVERKIGD